METKQDTKEISLNGDQTGHKGDIFKWRPNGTQGRYLLMETKQDTREISLNGDQTGHKGDIFKWRPNRTQGRYL